MSSQQGTKKILNTDGVHLIMQKDAFYNVVAAVHSEEVIPATDEDDVMKISNVFQIAIARNKANDLTFERWMKHFATESQIENEKDFYVFRASLYNTGRFSMKRYFDLNLGPLKPITQLKMDVSFYHDDTTLALLTLEIDDVVDSQDVYTLGMLVRFPSENFTFNFQKGHAIKMNVRL